MRKLEEWVHQYPRTCVYLVIVTTLNLILNLVELAK